MNLSQSINQHGFRRWYERQLIEGHLYLVGAFLALIAMLAGIETFEPGKGAASALILLTLAAGSGAAAFWAWRRFITLLGRAEGFASNATCPDCGAWGKLRALGAEPTQEARDPRWVNVCCKKCGAVWRLHDGPEPDQQTRSL